MRRSSKRRIAIFLSDILFHNGYVIVLEYCLVRFDLFPLCILLDYARHGKYSGFRSDPAQIYPYSQIILKPEVLDVEISLFARSVEPLPLLAYHAAVGTRGHKLKFLQHLHKLIAV